MQFAGMQIDSINQASGSFKVTIQLLPIEIYNSGLGELTDIKFKDGGRKRNVFYESEELANVLLQQRKIILENARPVTDTMSFAIDGQQVKKAQYSNFIQDYLPLLPGEIVEKLQYESTDADQVFEEAVNKLLEQADLMNTAQKENLKMYQSLINDLAEAMEQEYTVNPDDMAAVNIQLETYNIFQTQPTSDSILPRRQYVGNSGIRGNIQLVFKNSQDSMFAMHALSRIKNTQERLVKLYGDITILQPIRLDSHMNALGVNLIYINSVSTKAVDDQKNTFVTNIEFYQTSDIMFREYQQLVQGTNKVVGLGDLQNVFETLNNLQNRIYEEQVQSENVSDAIKNAVSQSLDELKQIAEEKGIDSQYVQTLVERMKQYIYRLVEQNMVFSSAITLGSVQYMQLFRAWNMFEFDKATPLEGDYKKEIHNVIKCLQNEQNLGSIDTKYRTGIVVQQYSQAWQLDVLGLLPQDNAVQKCSYEFYGDVKSIVDPSPQAQFILYKHGIQPYYDDVHNAVSDSTIDKLTEQLFCDLKALQDITSSVSDEDVFRAAVVLLAPIAQLNSINASLLEITNAILSLSTVSPLFIGTVFRTVKNFIWRLASSIPMQIYYVLNGLYEGKQLQIANELLSGQTFNGTSGAEQFKAQVLGQISRKSPLRRGQLSIHDVIEYIIDKAQGKLSDESEDTLPLFDSELKDIQLQFQHNFVESFVQISHSINSPELLKSVLLILGSSNSVMGDLLYRATEGFLQLRQRLTSVVQEISGQKQTAYLSALGRATHSTINYPLPGLPAVDLEQYYLPVLREGFSTLSGLFQHIFDMLGRVYGSTVLYEQSLRYRKRINEILRGLPRTQEGLRYLDEQKRYIDTVTGEDVAEISGDLPQHVQNTLYRQMKETAALQAKLPGIEPISPSESQKQAQRDAQKGSKLIQQYLKDMGETTGIDITQLPTLQELMKSLAIVEHSLNEFGGAQSQLEKLQADSLPKALFVFPQFEGRHSNSLKELSTDDLNRGKIEGPAVAK